MPTPRSHPAPAVHAETRVPTRDAELCAQAFGDPADPAVLLLAGTACSMDWWPPHLCLAIAAHDLYVLRYDQRDTGRATHDEPGRPTYTLPDLVDDAVAVLDAHHVEQAHWVGFSQGGWVAQLAALDRADRVASLVLMSTRPTGHGPADPDLPEVTDRLLAAWESAVEPDWNDRAAVLEYLVEGERQLAAQPFDESTAREICRTALARAVNIRSAVANHVQIDQGSRWRHRLGSIAARTLVLHGDSDPLFPPGNAEALAAAIPDARLRLLAGVGHELSPRRWDEYSALIAMLASGTSAS